MSYSTSLLPTNLKKKKKLFPCFFSLPPLFDMYFFLTNFVLQKKRQLYFLYTYRKYTVDTDTNYIPYLKLEQTEKKRNSYISTQWIHICCCQAYVTIVYINIYTSIQQVIHIHTQMLNMHAFITGFDWMWK